MRTLARKRLDPRRKPAQRRSRQTVAAILGAAARVFAGSGYAGATTNHIAERAGVSVGSLYEYFPSKDAILVALVEQHVDEAERELAAVLGRLRDEPGDIGDVVRRLVATMVRLHERDPGLHRVLFEEAPLPPRLRRRLARLEDAMTAEVAVLLEARGLEPADARTAARMGVHVLEALTHRLVLHVPRASAGAGGRPPGGGGGRPPGEGGGGRPAAGVGGDPGEEIAVLLAAYLDAKLRDGPRRRGRVVP